MTVSMGPSERDYDKDGFYFARYHPRARLSKRSSWSEGTNLSAGHELIDKADMKVSNRFVWAV